MPELKRNIETFGAASVGLMFFLNESAIFVSAIWAVVSLTIFFALYRKQKPIPKN